MRQSAGEATVYNALDWVIRNKDRFGIQSVSMSQGYSSSRSIVSDYCPKTPITESKIKSLTDSGVPVFFPTGNSRNYSRIDWPACIPASIAVGATLSDGTIATYSNYDPSLTDFFARGTNTVITVGNKLVNVVGTSASTVIAATQWATVKNAKPNLTHQEIYDLISKTATPAMSLKNISGKLINIQGALNV
jgi:hypothetical protein